MKNSGYSRDPVGLNRENAARFIGVSAGLFDDMVADGRMPPPRRAGARKLWHTGELEQALLALPTGEGGGVVVPRRIETGLDKGKASTLWS